MRKLFMLFAICMFAVACQPKAEESTIEEVSTDSTLVESPLEVSTDSVVEQPTFDTL